MLSLTLRGFNISIHVLYKLHDTLLLYPTMRMLTSSWILGQERREEDQR